MEFVVFFILMWAFLSVMENGKMDMTSLKPYDDYLLSFDGAVRSVISAQFHHF
jgi:hypothetical protein